MKMKKKTVFFNWSVGAGGIGKEVGGDSPEAVHCAHSTIPTSLMIEAGSRALAAGLRAARQLPDLRHLCK